MRRTISTKGQFKERMPYIMWLDENGLKAVVARCTLGSRIGGTARERLQDDLNEFYQTPEQRELEYQSVLTQVNKYNEENQ